MCQTSTVQDFVHCRSSITGQCEGGNARCIAWSRRRPHLNEAAEAATSCTRGSQPSGSLCCGRRRHFRKPILSTDKFKLKVISRSQLYIYTLNVSCIMLVYYFLPFIVTNPYLLFQISSGHNSVTVQNRTHVRMNFFA
jgi:hypothetical protein